MPDEPVCPHIAADSWITKSAPRYTSYPPAPFFHEGVAVSDFVQSLARLTPQKLVSLYLHIPFCRQLCLFCGCHTSITRRMDRIEHYLDSLKEELRLVSSLTTGPLRISHLHLGGGTPNIMSEAEIDDLFNTLRRLFDFGACREIAIELDPRGLSKEQVRVMAACGVTRVSLGVQDFNPEVQRVVHRVQPYDLVKKACDWLHSSGIRGINFDLMYGLPLQTPESVTATARQVVALNPDRIALFSYAHIPQLKRHQYTLENYGLPDVYDRLDMDRAARDVLTESGYTEIGMDHFARPEDGLVTALRTKRLHRNFQGYTDDAAEALIGFGASAISRMPEGYFQNERDLRPYQDFVRTGQLPIRRGLLLTEEDRLRAAIIQELMCYLECDVGALCDRYGHNPEIFDVEFKALAAYERVQLIVLEGRHVRLIAPHRMAIRVIAQIFDAYAANRNKTYSHVA